MARPQFETDPDKRRRLEAERDKLLRGALSPLTEHHAIAATLGMRNDVEARYQRLSRKLGYYKGFSPNV